MNRRERNADYENDVINGLGEWLRCNNEEGGHEHVFGEDCERSEGAKECVFNDMEAGEDAIDVDSLENGNTGDYRDAVLEVANLLKPLQLSRAALQTVFKCAPIITYSNVSLSDVESFCKEEVQKFADPQTTVYCSFCLNQLIAVNDVCGTRSCENFRKPCTNGTKSQKTVVTSFSIRNQLEMLRNSESPHLVEEEDVYDNYHLIEPTSSADPIVYQDY